MYCNINGKKYKLTEVPNVHLYSPTPSPRYKKTVTINVSKESPDFQFCNPTHCDPVPPDLKRTDDVIVINLFDAPGPGGTHDPIDPDHSHPDPASPPDDRPSPGDSNPGGGSSNSGGSGGSPGGDSGNTGGSGGTSELIDHVGRNPKSIVINYYI